ncbi:MAG: DUF3405 domain-containing protein [Clostridium sp.]|nr:DUF3405 domain-containing protein [Clostridium sp.]
MKTAILYVTHVYNDDIEHQIQKMYQETKEFATLYLVYQYDNMRMGIPEHIPVHSFTIRSLNELHYTPWGSTIMDGNFHFVLLDFYLKHPDFDYYWLVEYDVRFNGHWNTFFSFFQDKDEDFISAHMETVDDNPEWMRWHEIELKNIPINRNVLLRSFNPICRFSNRAFALLHSRCLLGDRGHNEILMPTLFKYFKLKIADFGGVGRYTYPNQPNLFYTYDTEDDAEDKCTHRCYPQHDTSIMKYPNMIYHPIK